jgi:transcriptional regulator with XRE-family HTH domain
MTGMSGGTAAANARFGEELRLTRERAGLSLHDFAPLVHYSVSYLSRIETGDRPALRRMAERCDAALDVGGALLALVPEPSSRRDKASGTASRSRSGKPGTRKLVGDSAEPAIGPATLLGFDLGTRAELISSYGPEFDTLIRQGDAAQAAGKMLEAGEWYTRAYRQAVGVPLAQAEAVIKLARRWSDPGQVDRDVVQSINTVLDDLSGVDGDAARLLRLRLNAHLAKKLSFAVSQDTAMPETGPAQGAVLARRILEQTPPDCPDYVRCEVLTECRWALFDYTQAAELLPMSRTLHDVALRAGSAHFQGEALTALAIDQLRTGQITSALATVEQHRTYAGRHPSAMARWLQCIFDTLLDLWRGNFSAAAEWIFGESQAIVAGLEAEMEIPADTLRQTRLGQAYWLLREQGRMADLFTSGLVGGVERYGYSPIWRAGLILALCETDHWTDAADQLVGFAEDTERFRTLPPSGWAIPTFTLLAEACAELASHDNHRAVAADCAMPIDRVLTDHSSEIALAGWPTVLVGTVARARGLLAQAVGDGQRARKSFRHAARRARTSRPHMARLRADLAHALLLDPAPGADKEAAALLGTALLAAEEMGMAHLADHVRTLQGRL